MRFPFCILTHDDGRVRILVVAHTRLSFHGLYNKQTLVRPLCGWVSKNKTQQGDAYSTCTGRGFGEKIYNVERAAVIMKQANGTL